MKILKQLFATLFILISFIACSEDEEQTQISLSKETISAKWVTENSDLFDTFEFNESGNYIVTRKGFGHTRTSASFEPIYFGTYQIVDDKTIILSGFGTITIVSLTNNGITFTLLQENTTEETVEIVGTKKETIAKTSKTDLLCKTWEIASVEIDGEEMDNYSGQVLFSTGGTYFVDVSDGFSSNIGVAQWKWEDGNETSMCYSWTTVLDCSSKVEMIELTANSLIIDSGVYIGNILFYTIRYELVPADNSSARKAVNNATRKKGGKGFLGLK